MLVGEGIGAEEEEMVRVKVEGGEVRGGRWIRLGVGLLKLNMDGLYYKDVLGG